MIRKRLMFVLSLVVIAALLTGCGSKSTSSNAQGTSSSNTTSSKADSSSGGSSSSKEIVLKAVSAWPQKVVDNAGLFDLIKQVNALGKGKVKIKYLGGPEAIPLQQQPNALKDGTVDITWGSAGYESSLVPASIGIKLSKLTPQQERKQGVTKVYDQIFKQGNAKFLVRGSAPDVHFHFYTNKPIKSLSDFKGMQFRGTPAYKDFLVALGASPVSLTPGDVYTALQRGVIKGYGWPGYGIQTFGWDKLTKYMIDPGFYQVDNLALMNLDTWNKLPKDVQQIFSQAETQVEKDMATHFSKMAKTDQQNWVKEGIKVIKLDPKTAKKFTDLAYSSAWKDVLKSDPVNGPALKKALGQ